MERTSLHLVAPQFLRLTHALARRQEFRADQMAAGVVGAVIMRRVLRKSASVPPLFLAYMNEVLMPVVRAGFLPPIASGFSDFLTANHTADVSNQIVNTMESGHADPNDTHPPLRERLVALASTADALTAPVDDEPAVSLLDGVEEQARLLLKVAVGSIDVVDNLRRIEWPMVGPAIAVVWRQVAGILSRWLSRFVADALPAGHEAFIAAGSDLLGIDEQNTTPEVRIARAVDLLTVGVSVLLLDNGWRAEARPESPIVLMRGNDIFSPHAAIRGLADDAVTTEAWKAHCLALGIAAQQLAPTQPLFATRSATRSGSSIPIAPTI
jgi:hypothetical protein